jgi:predicted acetyltransferase/catechol 2,3-dioxygenase-like lactoylglutathione lyase family enzyme
MLKRVHHVQITIPKGAEAAARLFYCGVLGLPEIEKPESLKGRGGFWVLLGDVQIHLGTEDGVDRTLTKAHIAYQVADVANWREKLMAHNIQMAESVPLPGYDRFEFRDPFGNRVEFIQPVPALVRPATSYKHSYIQAVREFHAEGKNPAWNYENLEANFDEYVAMELAKETDSEAGYVPQTEFWLVVGEDYVGRISLRHHLNEKLALFGGHIGYEVRPSMRQRGYGTLMCRLVLDHARALNLNRVLITCDDDNIGSQKIIEANGGILQDKIDNGRESLTRRYWIALK